MNEDEKTAYFIVEGGKPLELVKAHIAEVRRVREQNRAMCIELGVEHIRIDRLDGRMVAAVFPAAVPDGWTKPSKTGASRPKRGTAWGKRLLAADGHASPEGVISAALGIPLAIQYKSEGCSGWAHIGNMLTACGWLYCSADGPYAMWAPDVPAYVAGHEARGRSVEEPAKSFRMEFDGLRRIDIEEWELIVAQHNLKKKIESKPA